MGKPAIGAFFDIDHTVLQVNSGTQWVGYQWKTGQMGAIAVARALWWTAQYRLGWLNFDAMAAKVIAQYCDREVRPIEIEVQQWFTQEIERSICTQARERIAEHRQAGHTIALLTSATRFLSRPLAEVLQLEHVLCTEVEEADGRFTGQYLPPACYGPGKVVRAESFAREHEIDLDRSYFYSDSVSDLPMLDRVGEPRVVNPDPRLRRIAGQRGWPIQTWTAPATVRVTNPDT